MDESGDSAAIDFQDGVAGFAPVVERYQPLIYRLSLRMAGNQEDALDLTQDCFLKIYQNIHKWDRRSSFSTWVYRLVVNQSIDLLRKRGRPGGAGSGCGLPIDSVPARDEEGYDEVEERNHQRARLASAIARLPEAQKAILVLRHHEGLALKEIAEIRGCAIGTVKATLFAAFQSLRKSVSRSRQV